MHVGCEVLRWPKQRLFAANKHVPCCISLMPTARCATPPTHTVRLRDMKHVERKAASKQGHTPLISGTKPLQRRITAAHTRRHGNQESKPASPARAGLRAATGSSRGVSASPEQDAKQEESAEAQTDGGGRGEVGRHWRAISIASARHQRQIDVAEASPGAAHLRRGLPAPLPTPLYPLHGRACERGRSAKRACGSYA